jgi:ABC-type transport system involved in multi-copper enzyme maturation permease subunit
VIISMSVSARRVRAIFRKEVREYRRNGNIAFGMAIMPFLFLIQPLVQVFALPSSASGAIRHEDSLLYLLAIPAIVPGLVAAYAVVAERDQGTLEPVLTTPVSREEFLVGKALAALVPSVLIAYAVYALFLACVRLFANPAVASALLRWPEILAQVFFTPLIAAWSIWIGLAISARSKDIRVAQQLGVLACLPTVAVTSLVAFNVIGPSFGLALAAATLLVILDVAGWRVVSAMFNRERLITGSR